jgi:CheY-like chemotaxis protein
VKTVLVVDDEPAVREVIADILRDHEFNVVLAWSGRSMLEQLETDRPDLVVLDMMMPDGDGRDALQAMQNRPHLRDIPVVMMSAALGPGGLDTEISGFLRKPFNLDDLLEVVIGVIGPPAP